MIYFYELKGDEFERIARIDDGEIVEGEDELMAIDPREEAWEEADPEMILSRFNGPRVIATYDEDPEASSDT